MKRDAWMKERIDDHDGVDDDVKILMSIETTLTIIGEASLRQ